MGLEMFAIAPTDIDWFNTLRQRALGDIVNFWTPTPWNLQRLRAGDLWYFMLKRPIRRIGGYGIFQQYVDMRVSQAWYHYGPANGVADRAVLLARTQKYAQKRSTNYLASSDPVIGCIILSDPVLLDDQDFFAPEDYGRTFSKYIVKFKTFEGSGIPFSDSVANHPGMFEPLEPTQSAIRDVSVKDRVGQSAFRQMVLSAYGNRCAISGIRVTEVLEAAHIQPYINEHSNHIQNGICLRSDLHRLFDQGLISIDNDFHLLVSERANLTSTGYKKLAGRTLNLPKCLDVRPSLSAIQYHREQVFRG